MKDQKQTLNSQFETGIEPKPARRRSSERFRRSLTLKAAFAAVNQNIRSRPLLSGTIGAACALMLTHSAGAQTWNPTASGTYYWNNASNWNNGTVPNNSLTSVNLNPPSNLSGNQTIYEEGQATGKLSIGDGGGKYSQTLYADGTSQPALQLGHPGVTSVIYVNSPLQTPGTTFTFKTSIAAPLNLEQQNLQIISNLASGTSNQNFNAISLSNITNGTNLELTHVFAEEGFLSGINLSYSGNTTLDGGYSTLEPNSASLPSTTTVILSDTTDLLELAGDIQSIGSISGSGLIDFGDNTGSSLTTTANGTTFSGSLFGNGTLHVNGGGTLTLTGNSYTSVRNLGAFYGTIEVGPTGQNLGNGLSVNSDVALGAPGASLQLQGGTLYTTTSFSLLQQLTIPSSYVGTLSPSAGTTLTVSNAIAGGGVLTTTGAGTVILANSGNANGALSVGASTQFYADSDLGSSGGAINLAANLELLSNNTVGDSRTITLNTTGSFIVDANSTLTLQGLLTEVPSQPEFPNHAILTDSGVGTLVLTNTNNNYSGGTVINGTLSVSDDRQLGASAGSITIGATFVPSVPIGFFQTGTLITTANFTTARNITLGSYGGIFAPSAATTASFLGTISGGAAGSPFNVQGPGTVALSGSNTFVGGVYVSNGSTLITSNDAALGNASNTLELNNGTYQWAGSLETTLRPLKIDGNGGTVNLQGSGELQFTGPVTGTGALNVVAGQAILALKSNSNTFSGGTIISSGILAIGPVLSGSSSTPLGTGAVTLSGGELQVAGTVPTTPASQQPLSVTGFNQDVVVERSATNYQAAVTSSFDTPGSTTNGYAFYENGYNGNSGGLPQNHTFTSASNSAVSFTLAPYNSSNSLQFVAGGNSTGLTLTHPGAFSTISILAAASGTASGSVYLEFSDLTEDTYPVTYPDWFGSGPTALVVGSRLSLSDGSIQSVSGYPRLFEFDFTVPAADASKVITGLGFYNNIGGGTVNVLAVSGDGVLADSSQAYANSVNVTANSTISVINSPNATFGVLSIGSNSLTVTGLSGGSLSFPSAAVTGNATFTVSPGVTLNLGTVSGGGSITSGGAGTINYSANGGTLVSLNIPAGKFALQGTQSHLVVGSVSLGGVPANPVGLLDLGDNDLIVQNGNLATLTTDIQIGFNGKKKWSGTAGITSSYAALDSTNLHALGIMLNSADIYNIANPLDGYAPSTTDVLIKYTYFGDSNLDGKVDGSDYSRIDSGYLTQAAGWVNGDFNYDGVINGSDYTLIDNAFNTQGAQQSAHLALPTAHIAGSAQVPEPSSSLISLATLALLARRRGRR